MAQQSWTKVLVCILLHASGAASQTGCTLSKAQYYAEQCSCGSNKDSTCSNVGATSGSPTCGGTNCPLSFTYTGPTSYWFKGVTRYRPLTSNVGSNACGSASQIDGNTLTFGANSICFDYSLTTPPAPTCSDGVKNGDEQIVDCGGSCRACPTCSDGILNGDEVGVDCGGSCPACQCALTQRQYFAEQCSCGTDGKTACSNVGTSSGMPICGGTNCPLKFTYFGPTGFWFKGVVLYRPLATNSGGCGTASQIDGNTLGFGSNSLCFEYRATCPIGLPAATWDAVYNATFQATGCPNPSPSTGWWKTQTTATVLNDMMAYCSLVRDGTAVSYQKMQCCGSDTFCPVSCNLQSALTNCLPVCPGGLPQAKYDDVYSTTFQRTGCPNPTPGLSWWKTQSTQTVLNDMYAYCSLVRDGTASSGQKMQCCGSDTFCPVNCNLQPSFSNCYPRCSNGLPAVTGDAVYIATFQATGCPNPAPSTGWWKTQSAAMVLGDMNAYCTLVAAKTAVTYQRVQCCGSDTFCTVTCTQQTAFTTCPSTRASSISSLQTVAADPLTMRSAVVADSSPSPFLYALCALTVLLPAVGVAAYFLWRSSHSTEETLVALETVETSEVHLETENSEVVGATAPQP